MEDSNRNKKSNIIQKCKIFVGNKKNIRKIIFIPLIFVILVLLIIYFNPRKHIGLIYIGKSYCRNLGKYLEYHFNGEYRFTWWEHFSSGSTEDVISCIDETYGTRFGDKWEINIEMLRDKLNDIDMNKQDIIISIHRKLKTIYYDKNTHLNGADKDGMIIAVPVFEKESDDQVHLYVTDKKYNICPPELANDDIIEFNYFGNVRFEEE